jgi:hypothetical protein
VIGDHDPEDTYDAGDPIAVRLDVLTRAVTALRAAPNDNRRDGRRDDLLRVIARFRSELGDGQVWLDELRERLREL